MLYLGIILSVLLVPYGAWCYAGFFNGRWDRWAEQRSILD